MKLILGTMTFGNQVDDEGARSMLERFADAGGVEIDTAHTYCDGRTETLLGELLDDGLRDHLYVATKVNPWQDDGLRPESVRRQFSESLERLRADRVDLLYLHAPDLDTPIEQTLEACFELYQAGRFADFGLSNYAAWQVAQIVELCRHNGWMQPRVYQGMYNALTRDVERELIPCLRHFGLAFYAYNPLAGGLLSGRYADIASKPSDGRFVVHRSYPERYWKPEYFEIMEDLRGACAERNTAMAAAALRWLVHHSRLDAIAGDGIIIGVSQPEHLDANLAACADGPLDAELVALFERGWEFTRPDCFRYFRP